MKMTTVKKGSNGEAVKQLQMLLGITADGIYGSKTKAAVIAYQTAHNLEPDGICGPKTWASLQGETIPAGEKEHGENLCFPWLFRTFHRDLFP